MSFNLSTGLLTGTPTNSEVGSHTVIITATDSNSASTTQTFTISVVNVNDAPIFTSSPVTSINEDSLYTYSFTANDVDVGDAITFTVPRKPSWLSFNSGTNSLTGTPVNNDVGTHKVEIRATDLNGAVTKQTFTINVSNINDDPLFTSTPVTSATQNSVYTYIITTNDVDKGDVVTLSSSTIPSWLSFDVNTGVLTGTPGNSDVGNHTITINAQDLNGGTSQQVLP